MLPTIVRRNYAAPGFLGDLFSDGLLHGFNSWKTNCDTSGPAVNIEESDKEYLIQVATPGLSKENLKVSVNDGVLTISSDKKEEKQETKDRYIRRDFGYNAFKKSFSLPEETNQEAIVAKHKNGVLSVRIPKAEAKVIPEREVKIS